MDTAGSHPGLGWDGCGMLECQLRPRHEFLIWHANEVAKSTIIERVSDGREARMNNGTPRNQLCDVLIRWMIRRDMPEVLDIEHFSADLPWHEADFLDCLRQKNCIGMVAEHQERIVGYMIYELLKNQLRVLNFAVAPWARRQRVGTMMLEKLVNKLAQQRRQEIVLEIRESNMPALMFFKKSGLKAKGVLRDHFLTPQGETEDAYVMRYYVEHDAASIHAGGPHFFSLPDESTTKLNRAAAAEDDADDDCDDYV